jgi:hypothetical protein
VESRLHVWTISAAIDTSAFHGTNVEFGKHWSLSALA